MKREPRLEQYFFTQFNVNFKVYSVKKIRGNYGASIYCNKSKIIVSEDCLDYYPVLWHEIGHYFTTLGWHSFLVREVLAQCWAFRNIKDKSLYKESYDWVCYYWSQLKNGKTKQYAQASDIILQCLQKECINNLR